MAEKPDNEIKNARLTPPPPPKRGGASFIEKGGALWVSWGWHRGQQLPIRVGEEEERIHDVVPAALPITEN